MHPLKSTNIYKRLGLIGLRSTEYGFQTTYRNQKKNINTPTQSKSTSLLVGRPRAGSPGPLPSGAGSSLAPPLQGRVTTWGPSPRGRGHHWPLPFRAGSSGENNWISSPSERPLLSCTTLVAHGLTFEMACEFLISIKKHEWGIAAVVVNTAI